MGPRRLLAAAGIAAALLAGCVERDDEAVRCPVQDARRAPDGRVFVRYVTTRETGDATRWMRRAGCIDGWVELASAGDGPPVADDDLLVHPAWGAAVVRYEADNDWRAYPLDAITIAVGRLPDHLAPWVLPPDAAPTAWRDLPARLPFTADPAAQRRIARLETIDWGAIGCIPYTEHAHAVTWLDARGNPIATSTTDGAALLRCVADDDWRPRHWIRVPVALLDAPLTLADSQVGLVALRQRRWLARFRAPDEALPSTASLPTTLIARTVPTRLLDRERWLPLSMPPWSLHGGAVLPPTPSTPRDDARVFEQIASNLLNSLFRIR